jgi:NAD-dependent SIR2 family protein deacetylase
MDLIFFENDIFCQIFNINLNEIVWNFFKRTFWTFFQEHFKNILRKLPSKNHKSSKKASGCGLCYHVYTL